MKVKDIKTTGQLRDVIAETIQRVADGSMSIDHATTLHKLAKTITESLYSETKIAMFRHEAQKACEDFGNLPIGERSK